MNVPPSSLRFAVTPSRLHSALTADTQLPSSSGQVADKQSLPPGPGFFGKRTLDLICLFLGLPGALLLMSVLAVLIKIVSPGPVIFRQERVGLRRKPFTCFKFRTMYPGSDSGKHQQHLEKLMQSDAPMTKMDAGGDPRLIPFGRLLRATGLDELPQLINVLRGEMSLVGPRPCTPYELAHYRPWQCARFDTLPGMTGLWQVSGKNTTSFTQMINLDIQYAKNRSVWLDIKIMAATFSAILSQVRAATGDRSEPRPGK